MRASRVILPPTPKSRARCSQSAACVSAGVGECNNGTLDFSKRRPSARYLVARKDSTHGYLEDTGSRPAHGTAAQYRRRRARGLGWHGGEHRAVFVYQIDPITIGKASSVEATSPMGSLERISLSTACPTKRCVLAIATGWSDRPSTVKFSPNCP